MTEVGQDADLRRRFARLRREDADRASSFAPPIRRASPARVPWRTAAALVATATVVVLWARSRREQPAPTGFALDLGATAWIAPTDFLLHTPGSELLSTVPALDVAALPEPMDRREAPPAETPNRRIP